MQFPLDGQGGSFDGDNLAGSLREYFREAGADRAQRQRDTAGGAGADRLHHHPCRLHPPLLIFELVHTNAYLGLVNMPESSEG